MQRLNVNAISEENRQIAIARKAAIMSNRDYKFVPLCLNNPSRRQVAGIHVIEATPYYDKLKRRNAWSFQVIGGAADFQEDINFGSRDTYFMFIDDWNMRFLASCYDQGLWDIMDIDVENEVIEIRNANYTNMVNPYVGTSKVIDPELQRRLKTVKAELETCSADKVEGLRSELLALLKKSTDQVVPKEKKTVPKQPLVAKKIAKKTVTKANLKPLLKPGEKKSTVPVAKQLKTIKMLLGRTNLTDEKRSELKKKMAMLKNEIKAKAVVPGPDLPTEQESELVSIEE